MKTIFEVQQNYGHTRFFPVNEVAIKVTKLVGQKSLTPENIKQIKELGFEVELQSPDYSKLIKKGK